MGRQKSGAGAFKSTLGIIPPLYGQLYALISFNNIVRNNSIAGIDLTLSDDNVIWLNEVTSNSYGISLSYSNYNYIMKNSFEMNEICIVEVNCSGNVFYDNEACAYGQEDVFYYGLILFIF